MALAIKPKQECRWDLISLGEVMLRLDPDDTTMATFQEVIQVMKGVGARTAR